MVYLMVAAWIDTVNRFVSNVGVSIDGISLNVKCCCELWSSFVRYREEIELCAIIVANYFKVTNSAIRRREREVIIRFCPLKLNFLRAFIPIALPQ